jgi:hypothetical protein
MIDAFSAAAPVAMLDANYAELDRAGMLRPGDEARYEFLRRHIGERLDQLPIELEQNREAPTIDFCYPYIQCGDTCVVFPEECVLCDAPAEAGEPGAAIPDAAIPDAAIPDDAGAEPPAGDGDQCLQPIDVYAQALRL